MISYSVCKSCNVIYVLVIKKKLKILSLLLSFLYCNIRLLILNESLVSIHEYIEKLNCNYSSSLLSNKTKLANLVIVAQTSNTKLTRSQHESSRKPLTMHPI